MADHGYEGGRLDLPFVGISTFGKRPYVGDWSAVDADVAVLGAPFDFGTQWRPGARFGPRGVREASTLFSFGHAGAYDHEDDAIYLPGDVRIVDIGDADIVHTDTVKSHANIKAGVRAILAAGALPVTIGGDHSINIPCIDAFDDQGDIHVLQIDAHLDFVDERHGVRFGHGNPMRRAAEKPYVTGLTQLGIRNVGSTAKEGYEDARARGSDILLVRQVRALGPEATAARIPNGARIYITIDIDAFCPSIAPGTGTPSHGGFLYYDVLEILQEVANRHDIVGIDLVEVAPDYDQSGSTTILAAQVLLNLLGLIFHARGARRAGLGVAVIAPALWHRIKAALAPGIAARDALGREPATAQAAVLVKRLKGVLATGRMIPAVIADPGRQDQPIGPDRQRQQARQRGHGAGCSFLSA